MNAREVYANVCAVAEEMKAQRRERQRRTTLSPDDFLALHRAGLTLTGVPVGYGGVFEDPARSVRQLGETFRALAQADASLALVASMHPAVLYSVGWLAHSPAPPPYAEAWEAQRRWAFGTALEGAWWGTITSEPGSGGDIMKTRAVARQTSQTTAQANTQAAAQTSAADGPYRLTGQKHFGSGSGVTSYMVTTAVPEGEAAPAWFYLELRGVPWDGSRGVTLTAPWDAPGMRATQSHALRFEDFPARRTAWPDALTGTIRGLGGFVPCLFTAVTVGILDAAVREAHARLEGRRNELDAYERVAWTSARTDYWLALQAYEGMVRSTEEAGGEHALMGKTAVAELAERTLRRLSRAVGGGAYSHASPLSFWLEDVRALGYLRPPWGLAYSTLYDSSWA